MTEAAGRATPKLQFGALARQRIVREALCAFDLVIASGCLSVYAALAGHEALPPPPIGVLAWALLLATWHAGFRGLGFYRGERILKSLGPLRCAAAGALVVGSVGAASYVGYAALPHSSLLLAVPATAIGLALGRKLFARFLKNALRDPRRLQRVLIVGSGEAALAFAASLEAVPEMGFEVAGFVDDDWDGMESFRNRGHRVVSDLKNAADFLREEVIDDVVIAAPLSAVQENLGRLLEASQSLGIHVRILGCALDRLHEAMPELQDEAAVLLSASASIVDQWGLVVKRAFDVMVSGALLILAAPVFAVTAALVVRTSPGPVFFVQERLGLRRRRFSMLKFRTMREGADQEIASLEDQNQVDGAVFKIGDDPRLTQIGKFLRRFSIDELPQLWNVLRGDMSLVGPRPLPVRDYLRFEELAHLRRFSVRPGLTGLWQISGRSTLSFDRWIELDLEYIDSWSLALDLKILAKTPGVVASGRGAY